VAGRPRDESELIGRAQRGDTRAYGEIVQMHQGIAFRTAFLIAGSREDAEEAVQDAFVKAFRALGRFRRGAALRPWLLTIVANEARNRRRSSLARPTVPFDDEAADWVDVSAEAGVLEAERGSEIGRALAGLPRADREVLFCRFFLELSERETAQVLSVRPGTVKSRLARSLGRLRSGLEVAS